MSDKNPLAVLTNYKASISERLRAYRKYYEAGYEIAARDALRLLEKWHEEEIVEVPKWLVTASLKLMTFGVLRSKSISRRYKTDFMLIRRYTEVERLRRKGLTLERAYEEAAENLTAVGLDAAVETVIEAHKKVRKALNDPSEPIWYYPLSWSDELFQKETAKYLELENETKSLKGGK